MTSMSWPGCTKRPRPASSARWRHCGKNWRKTPISWPSVWTWSWAGVWSRMEKSFPWRHTMNVVNLADLAGENGDRQELLVDIQIYSESIWRTIYEEDKPVRRDEVSPADLALALAGVNPGTGLLPQNTLFLRQDGDETCLGIYLPPAVQNLHVEGKDGRRVYRLPLPPLVLVGRGTSYRLYALAGENWPAAETQLYHAPFPNIYSNGLVCRGSVAFPPAGPETIHRAAALFFESQFNEDLAGGKSRKYPLNVLQMWAEVEQAEVYPVDDLNPANLKMEDLLK
ncbi:MAG: hypothetical protein D6784_14560 [Chloroflexi bacterium]|nr:MAG: hypothetical protein D6784_14560 [Chloroflexota bacterium]